ARVGPWAAFGVPGVLMLMATIVFWMGRNKFVHIPPGGWRFVRESLSGEGLRAAGKLCIIFIFVAMFWALFDQTGSAWVLQAERMDKTIFGYELLSSQIQAANPALIMVMIPLFTYLVYPMVSKVWTMTPLRKIAVGFFVTIPAFALPAWIEMRISAGEVPHISWQLLAYVIMTAAEVMISITCLEFSYTQAPRSMKSFIMALFFMSVSVGNLFTAAVNHFIQNPDGTSKLAGASYYWFFTAAIAITALLFTVVAALYREKTYIQEEEPIEPRCERCGSSLRGITGTVCPECGSPIARN
ncbi:MAG: MFS transporter, partial [Myxococcota bacterium]